MTRWRDPELGTFLFDGNDWVGQCQLPAFKVFTFREGRRNSGRSQLKLRFQTESETDEPPDKGAVSVAGKLLKNQERLAARVKKAIWNDLNGRGPDSGMWWHGDETSVAQNIHRACDGKSHPLEQPDDLHRLMGATSILVRDRMYLYEKPSATMMFEAAFDTEHGLGVLTDGNRVVGLGYQSSVGPFFQEQIRKRG